MNAAIDALEARRALDPHRRLSKNFTLREAMRSQLALRHGIDNCPSAELVPALEAVAAHVLQPVRDFYARPFTPSSWYRCLDLNRRLGSRDSSQHVRGQAVDFEVPGISNVEVAMWCRDRLETFDQLILEFHTPGDATSGWVHCSWVSPADNRGEVLTISANGVRRGLP